MPRRADLWRIGLVDAPIQDIARAGTIDGFAIDWLAEPGDFAFEADPFAIVIDDDVHLFAETFDYRERHGRIVHRAIAADGTASAAQVVVDEAWHLSYPFVFRADGETYMLPEASRSGGLNLYRATSFPDGWEKVARVDLDVPAIDATAFHHDGRWWLAYASGKSRSTAQSTLHLASSDHLAGPYTPHPANPVLVDQTGARPGGTPFLLDGRLILPVQDCIGTYGAAVRLLAVDELTMERATFSRLARLAPPQSAGRYRDGLHTLSACGNKTLIDVKRVHRSLAGLLLDVRRKRSR